MSTPRTASTACRGASRGSFSLHSSSSKPLPTPAPAPGRARSPRTARSFTTAASPRAPSSGPSPVPRIHLPELARTDPAQYAASRPQPLSAIFALAARIGLSSPQDDQGTARRRVELVAQACRHPSWSARADSAQAAKGTDAGVVREPLWAVHGRSAPAEGATDDSAAASELALQQYLDLSASEGRDNASLATVGNALLGLFASEHLHLKYPHLPTRVLKAAVSAYVGPGTSADVARELGVGAQGVLRWSREGGSQLAAAARAVGARRGLAGTGPEGLMYKDVLASAMRALVGAVFQEQGLGAAREFVSAHFLSRQVDLAALLKFENPKRVLSVTCDKYGRERPQSRMIAETGRLSMSPVFVVGIWSGAVKLGEGSGSSIRMAEFRAAEDALRRLYLSETPSGTFDIPSSTLDATFSFPTGTGTGTGTSEIARAAQSAFRPQPIGVTEVMHESADRSSRASRRVNVAGRPPRV